MTMKNCLFCITAKRWDRWTPDISVDISRTFGISSTPLWMFRYIETMRQRTVQPHTSFHLHSWWFRGTFISLLHQNGDNSISSDHSKLGVLFYLQNELHRLWHLCNVQIKLNHTILTNNIPVVCTYLTNITAHRSLEVGKFSDAHNADFCCRKRNKVNTGQIKYKCNIITSTN